MKNLITYEEISQLARPCTTDEDMAAAMIAEAQRVEIKPRLGDALYLKLLDIEEAASTAPDRGLYQILLEGGRWTESCGATHLLTGIKTALAYYALARITRDGNIQATTYGAVVKDDQYSVDPERAERQRQYRELFSQADCYMAEALTFIAKNCGAFPEYKAPCKMRSNRMTIRTIGK